LNACSHSGLIDEAKKIYSEMKSLYGVNPNLKHKTCIVDCLSRLEGRLEEAEVMIKRDEELSHCIDFLFLLIIIYNH